MRPEDVEAAERLSAEAFHEVDVRAHRPGLPEPELRPVARASGWIVRTHHLLATDPGGCWVADDDRGMLGFATSFVRETTWLLATYAVRSGLQGRGIGRQLLETAMHHGRSCLHGMLAASSDPKALRRYRLAGFDLHPQMVLRGSVARSEIPVVEKVREGTSADVDLMDSVDRRTRGAGHGPDHPVMLERWPLLVSDTSTGSGYVYVDTEGSVTEPALLAATNRRTAVRLLWAALAMSGDEAAVTHVTAANQWAIEVATAARLELSCEGYLALRNLRPPTPYIHNGALL